jgi:hypothetical protein
LRSREFGDQQSVADGDLVFQERLSHGRYEVSESDTTVLCCLLIYVVSRTNNRCRQCVRRFPETT